MPELDKNRVVNQHKALVFDGEIRYDLILGANFLTKTGIDIRFDSELPMCDPKPLDNSDYLAMAKALEVHREEEQIFGRDWYDPDCYATEILDAKYEKVSTDEVVDQCTHLSATQKEDCLLYTSPSPRDLSTSRMPSSA